MPVFGVFDVDVINVAGVNEDVEGFVLFEFVSEGAGCRSVRLVDALFCDGDDVCDGCCSISREIKRIE